MMNVHEALENNLRNLLVSLKVECADSDNIIMAVTKLKEIERKLTKVEEQHKAKIFPQERIMRTGEKKQYYSTSAPWLGVGRKLTRSTLEELIEELYKHYYPDSSINGSCSVKEVFELTMAKKESNDSRSNLTLVHNRADWSRYIEGRPLTQKEIEKGLIQYDPAPFLDIPIKDLKRSMIVDYFDKLIGKGNVTSKQVNNIRSVINEVLQFALDQDIDCINPRDIKIDKSRCKKTPSDSNTIYDHDEREKLINAIRAIPKQTVYTLAIQFIFCMPLRIGELKAIKWSTLDLVQGYVSILGQIIDKEDGDVHRKQTFVPYIKGKKDSGYRTIPLSNLAKNVLLQLKQLNGEREYVFANNGGFNPITTNRFNENLKKYCKIAGIPYRSSHKARFCTITSLFDNGADLKEIQKAAGHSTSKMTEHYIRNVQKASFNKEVLEKACGFGSLG